MVMNDSWREPAALSDVSSLKWSKYDLKLNLSLNILVNWSWMKVNLLCFEKWCFHNFDWHGAYSRRNAICFVNSYTHWFSCWG